VVIYRKTLTLLTPLGPIISSTRLSSQISIRTKQSTQRSAFDLCFRRSHQWSKHTKTISSYSVTNARFQINLHTPRNIAHLILILDFIEVYTGLYPMMHHFSFEGKKTTVHVAVARDHCHDNAMRWSMRKEPEFLDLEAHTPDISRPCSARSISQKLSPACPQIELIYRTIIRKGSTWFPAWPA